MGFTPEERAAELKRLQELADYGERPSGPVTELPPSRPVPEGIASADDLIGLSHRTRWVPMPRGKKICVHPLSLEEAGWVNAQAMAFIRRRQIKDDDPARGAWYNLGCKLFQLICAGRQGEQPGSPPVYSPSHEELLAKNLGWEKIQQLGNLSDVLGLEAGELELITDFFGLAARFSTTLSSRLTTDSPSLGAILPALEEFGSCVLRVKQRGGLLPSDADELAVIVAGLEAETEG